MVHKLLGTRQSTKTILNSGVCKVHNNMDIQCMSPKVQKLVIPRTSMKLRCHTLQNTTDPSKMLKMRRTFNIKKPLGDSKKKKLHSKFIAVLSRKRNTFNRSTFENISKVSILLLYLHFLLCYYLSFTKTQRFVELFETCPLEDNEYILSSI
ncbi:uncharacterized protein LOC128882390 [Hylaeus volcanicus]|uniref:uncharacterized protein LOC128882390 n=1 Tax=Hylaeus volcanicus TaxID=313075 RepID=UPI0023B7814A|nr:uncharacterized protein LOC128882390 [Hylaeus volcanicus]